MNVGDIFRTKSIQCRFNDGLVTIGFSAPKGKVFVAVMLGVEPDGIDDDNVGEAVDADEVLRGLGWVRRKPSRRARVPDGRPTPSPTP